MSDRENTLIYERKMKSPVFSRFLTERNGEKIWSLYHKIWSVSEDGTYHSPVEEELGEYREVNSGRCDEKITYYDVVKGPVTLKFVKIIKD